MEIASRIRGVTAALLVTVGLGSCAPSPGAQEYDLAVQGMELEDQ